MPGPVDIERLFAHALKLPVTQRREFVERACAGDPASCKEILSLLNEHEGASGFLAAPHEKTISCSHKTTIVPKRIGEFEIGQEAGRGGFAVVYRATQDDPSRVVAIKVLQEALLHPTARERFQLEAAILGRLDHPNLGTVYYAGTFEDNDGNSRPYFAMEWIEGLPLTVYCDKRELTVRERVGLMIDICNAVHHAHLRGVVHRDLKPSNILVVEIEGKIVPRVIDFGIAKAMDRAVDATATLEGQILGTPAYMSPEQALGDVLAVDIQSDVYALGVILYELLTGSHPIETHPDEPLQDLLRRICEEEPDRLTDCINSLPDYTAEQRARHRKLGRSSLLRSLRGDLNWITLRALEKNPKRRYESVQDFGADLFRYIEGRPVAAGPPGMTYRTGKFLRRNRALVTAVLSVTFAIVVGTITTTIGWMNAVDAREQQTKQAYDDGIALAGRILLSGADVKLAKKYIANVPEELRGWEWRYLRRELDLRFLTFDEHQASVKALAISQDGSLLASCDDSGDILVRDASNYEIISRHKAPVGVRTLDFSDDGAYLFGGCWDGHIRSWKSRQDGVSPFLRSFAVGNGDTFVAN